MHECGWTAGEFDLTPFLRAGATNTIAVRLDSRESLDQPPFGGVVDYLAYGGLYREAHLEVTGRARIADVFARPDHLGSLGLDAQIEGELDGLSLRIALDSARGERLLDESHPLSEHRFTASFQVGGITPWSPECPDLYRLSIALVDDEGSEVDAEELRIGFRTIEWRAEGLFLNGRPFALRGLNRHQSYPHLGYAAPARAQRLDADILKGELGCTVVRTSHYPQSHHFIERCDEIGLLVITEIPGWQHIGGSEWKTRAVRNTIDMVRQWRNHPSIIAWGVRINESQDDDAFYARTNAAARELDPTRPTTGVRNFPKSHLHEDVYAYNDFIHSGSNRGVDPKNKVTPDPGKGYFVSEHNGHMFPTKAYDDEEHRLSQALRHARVQDDAAGPRGSPGRSAGAWPTTRPTRTSALGTASATTESWTSSATPSSPPPCTPRRRNRPKGPCSSRVRRWTSASIRAEPWATSSSSRTRRPCACTAMTSWSVSLLRIGSASRTCPIPRSSSPTRSATSWSATRASTIAPPKGSNASCGMPPPTARRAFRRGRC